jgi:hypothetical protein
MLTRTILVLAATVSLLGSDTADVNRYKSPMLPGAVPDFSSAPKSSNSEVFLSAQQQASSKQSPLQPQSRIEIVRYISGEFAKAVKPIPSGKKGFKIEVGKKLDESSLKDALHGHQPAALPGDTVQITSVEFHPKEIVIQINGGGKPRFNLKDHIQIGMGGGPGIGGTPTATPPELAQQQSIGGTLILDFGRNVPDMSADDVMTDLQSFLDFSKEHSGAVNWIDTLPPQFKQAITDHEALEGMNHEMVLAALGRPEHKVRERDPDGTETEDWIYGTPPARTTFVTFTGDKVIRVKQFD